MSSISLKGIIVGNLVALFAGLGLGRVLVVMFAVPYEAEDFAALQAAGRSR